MLTSFFWTVAAGARPRQLNRWVLIFDRTAITALYLDRVPWRVLCGRLDREIASGGWHPSRRRDRVGYDRLGGLWVRGELATVMGNQEYCWGPPAQRNRNDSLRNRARGDWLRSYFTYCQETSS